MESKENKLNPEIYTGRNKVLWICNEVEVRPLLDLQCGWVLGHETRRGVLTDYLLQMTGRPEIIWAMISVVHDRLDRHHGHLAGPGVRIDRRTKSDQTPAVRMSNGAHIAQQLTILRFAL